MNKAGWSQPVSTEAMQRRAAGRKHINAQCKLRQTLRRFEIIELWTARKIDLLAVGTQAALARRFGLNRCTVCRDVRAILARSDE